MTAREQIGAAFFGLVAGAADFAGSNRTFVHWDSVNKSKMPYLTLLKGPELRQRQEEGLPLLVLTYSAFVYLVTGTDPDVLPETAMNEMLDAIDQAVAPSGIDALNGNKQTLGGLVSHCYSSGRTFINTGAIDGKAVAAIPFLILVPWY